MQPRLDELTFSAPRSPAARNPSRSDQRCTPPRPLPADAESARQLATEHAPPRRAHRGRVGSPREHDAVGLRCYGARLAHVHGVSPRKPGDVPPPDRVASGRKGAPAPLQTAGGVAPGVETSRCIVTLIRGAARRVPQARLVSYVAGLPLPSATRRPGPARRDRRGQRARDRQRRSAGDRARRVADPRRDRRPGRTAPRSRAATA